MTVAHAAHAAHAARIDAGVGFEWDRLPAAVTSVAGVDPAAADVVFRREGTSHVGLHSYTAIRRLWASQVDAAFLDEIAAMPALEMLSLQRVTATDLQPLARLRQLRRLIVRDATRVADLEWTRALALESLALENLKSVCSLEPLADQHGLRALGVEGAMWTAMRVHSLEPLRSLERLEYLFLTNLRVRDGSLRPLHGLARLRFLQCARYYDHSEFAALAVARPELEGNWLQWS
ncbi:MAG TPA: hypothetical protein VGE88_11530 [Lysobacter sp.]